VRIHNNAGEGTVFWSWEEHKYVSGVDSCCLTGGYLFPGVLPSADSAA
jgi:hypothetical protein